MHWFNYHDFRWFEKHPVSPGNLRNKVSDLIYNSYNTKAKVETCNPETGEYRIVLQGTLDFHQGEKTEYNW